MAAQVKKELHVDPELIPGSGGVFEVKVDGKLIFSKSVAGRFPEAAEIVSAIK